MTPEDVPGFRLRWSDDRLDDRLAAIDSRMEMYEDTAEAISELPERVSGISSTVAGLVDNQTEIRKDIRELRGVVERRFNKVDADHAGVRILNARALQPRPFWDKFKDTMAVLIPIIIALIAAWATVQAAGIGQQP